MAAILPSAEIVETILDTRHHGWLRSHPDRNRIAAAMIAAVEAAGRVARDRVERGG